ncbi:vitamin K epoxide reductase family protein [Actinomyces wuliandei]|uniref:vitamin K epoxide reductase family protein n=1 Tax=Actinomyces wuliandei TaxID=2057743 RepID=UPI000FD6BD7A|nr:vitamin K epoxide reductase family protein [Actinomyces wuliandei]
MVRVPTDAEIDAMSEEELEAYLSAPEDYDASVSDDGPGAEDLLARVRQAGAHPGGNGQAPGGWRAPSGAPRSYGWLLVVCSLLGLLACWRLIDSHLTRLRDPMANLTCDVNPLISCGETLDVWQGNLLGVPNSFVGAMAFAALLTVGAVVLVGLSLPRWMWWALSLGCLGGVAFVAWFLAVSVVTFGKLCPFCMLVWAVTIPVAASTWGWAAAGGHLGLGGRAALVVLRARWWVAAGMYLVVVLVAVVGLWDQWRALLG